MSFHKRVDARFLAFAILGTLTASMFGCFAYGIAVQTTNSENASILSVNDALHQMELRQQHGKTMHELTIANATP